MLFVAVGLGCLISIPMMAVAKALQSEVLNDASPFIATAIVLMDPVRRYVFHQRTRTAWLVAATGFVFSILLIWSRFLVWP
jgi:hypothetical protein